jgi:hypothetical protein
MDALLFLLVAFGLIAVGTTVVLVRAREPKGEYRGIKSFQREMQALAPATPPEGMERPAGVDPLLYEHLRTAMAETATGATASGASASGGGATATSATATDEPGGPATGGTSDVSGPRPAERQE